MLLEEEYLHFMTPLGSPSANKTFLLPSMVWGGGGEHGIFFVSVLFLSFFFFLCIRML